MELTPGVKLGPYEILARIGAGGMGDVYRARDARLGRDVAIKVSAAQFTERFEREAHAVAALNHPHICTLYDIGPNYLVMEYIEGRPPGSPVEIADAVKYAMHIADALDAAHAKGIIHRDIKPANVMITARGEAKVLDFGLAQFNAKKETAGEGDSSTALMLTAAGSAVGTVAYMSPEQARGQMVDGRTDIWALGVMLYEMVTGARPFQGATQASIFDAIMNRAPAPPSLLNPGVPPGLEHAILKATEKDRTLRYQTAADLLADLRRIERDAITASAPFRTPLTVPSAVSDSPSVTPPTRPAGWYIALAAILLAAIAGGLFLMLRPTKNPAADRADWQQLTNFTDTATDPALSPDGRMLAFKRGGSWFVDGGQIYVKLLPDGKAVQLTHDARGKMAPVFSPDGSRIAYTADDEGWATWEVPVLAGGEPRRMLANAEGLQWIDPRHIMFSEIKIAPHMTVEVSEESLAGKHDVYTPEGQYGMAHFSVPSPDRHQVVILEMQGLWLPCRLVPFDGSSKGKLVGPVPASCTAAAWSPDGKWMYFTANTGQGSHIWRQKSEGGPAEQITRGPTTEQGIAMAPDGHSLITSAGTFHSSAWIHDVNGDRQISAEGNASQPYISSDGRVFYLSGQIGGLDEMSLRDTELWFADPDSGHTASVLPGVRMARYVVSPDGKAVAWSTAESSTGDGTLWYAPLDQRTPPRNLVSRNVLTISGIGASGNIYYVAREGQGLSTYRIARDGTETRRIAAAAVGVVGGPTISPDEQWLVMGAGDRYVPAEYAQELTGDRKVELCTDCDFVWSPDGKSVIVSMYDSIGGPGDRGVTGVIPLPAGKMLPALPAGGIKNAADLKKIPGVRLIPYTGTSPGPGGTYAYTKAESLANLYRIPLQ